ncbi:hypothetical protein [Cohnella cellulosilytica]|uniref:WD40 repeat domain-containing protein n=1 Tax=Cohnella cellulosilytica TaxID=986710 RepID=A0ABW2FLW4_9BACL
MTDSRRGRRIGRGLLAGLLAAVTLLAGCTGGLRTETIVIPDVPEAVPPSGNEAGDWEVAAIYRLPAADEPADGLYRWTAADKLVRLVQSGSGRQTVEAFEAPYGEAQRLLELDADSSDVRALSPDGSRLSVFSYGAGKPSAAPSLTLISLPDGAKKVFQPPAVVSRSGGAKLIWSDNSRFLSYLALLDQGELGIGVYDEADESMRTYELEDADRAAFFYSVKLSDDGDGALMVKEQQGEPPSLTLFRKRDGKFVQAYEHPIHSDGRAEWIDSERIVFIGTDGTLFLYDSRNGELSVLLDRAANFKLSDDRRLIAYSTRDATIEVARLRGNSLYYGQTAYRGLVADELLWSPDNGALLVQGRKPYETGAAQAASPAPAEDSGNRDVRRGEVAQWIVLDFAP